MVLRQYNELFEK
jgi:hypothetical protein